MDVSNAATGVVLVLVGVALIGGGYYLGVMQPQQVMDSVEETDATILSTDMEQATEQDDGETQVEFYPRIEYEYSVEGQQQTNDRIYHSSKVNNEPGELEGKEFDSQSDARDVLQQFPEGESVTVYYYPDDPGRSFLKPVESRWLITGVMGLFGLLMIGAGVQKARE